jgi:hypothetical protein
MRAAGGAKVSVVVSKESGNRDCAFNRAMARQSATESQHIRRKNQGLRHVFVIPDFKSSKGYCE